MVFIAGIILVSCRSNFATITIENANPAKDELPSDIRRIALVNRSMNKQFMNHCEDSLQMYFYRKGYQLSNIVLDSLASDTTVQALASLLNESGRYQTVIPGEKNIYRDLSYEIIPDTLDPEVVSKYCRDYQTDALMVLERFYTKTMADFSAEKEFRENGLGIYSYYASLDLKYNAFFRIYKPGEKSPIKQINLTDTIYWESFDYKQKSLMEKLPTVKQALINASIKVALDIDSRISPNWIPEKRGYFLFNRNDDRGEKLIQDNNFDEAEKYWTGLTKSENKKIRSKAEFNMALINELNGNIESAIIWAQKSYYSFYRHQTETYLNKLKVRKEILQKMK